MRKKDLRPGDVNLESSDWAEQHLIRKITYKVCQGANREGPRQRVELRLGLGQEFRKISKEDILTRKRHFLGNRMEFPYPLSCSKGHQEKSLLSQFPERNRLQRFKGGRSEEA